MFNSSSGWESSRQERKGSWKRTLRIGQKDSQHRLVASNENLNVGGYKRGLYMITESDELKLETGLSKRFKGQNKENELSHAEVGVASREWPQLNR